MPMNLSLLPPSLSTCQFDILPPPFLLCFPAESCALTPSLFFPYDLPLAQASVPFNQTSSTSAHCYFTIMIVSKSSLQPSVPQSKPHLKSRDRGCSPPHCEFPTCAEGYEWLGSRQSWRSSVYLFGADEKTGYPKHTGHERQPVGIHSSRMPVSNALISNQRLIFSRALETP